VSLWVVDASVVVEILLRTEIGERAWAVIEPGHALAPDLLDAEVLAVLRREHLRGVLAGRRAEEALADLAHWDIERLACASLVVRAWRYRHNVSAYDALYLAAAHVTGAALLTADGPLARAPPSDISIHDVRTPAI
jgi:predicted nucleic acid-binding protein